MTELKTLCTLDLCKIAHLVFVLLPKWTKDIGNDFECKTDDTSHNGLQRIVQQKEKIYIGQQIKCCSEKKGNPIAHPMILIYRCVHGSKM